MSHAFTQNPSRLCLLAFTTVFPVLLSWRLSFANLPQPPALLVLAFGPHSDTLAIGTRDGIQLRQIQNAKLSQVLLWDKGEMWSVAFSPCAETAAVVVSERKVRPLRRGEPPLLLTTRGSIEPGTDKVKLLDMKTGKVLRVLKSSDSTLQASVFSADGRILACRALNNQRDNTVLLWDTKTGSVLHKIRAVVKNEWLCSAMDFSPDSKIFVSASFNDYTDKFGKVRLWDVATGKLRRVIKVPRASRLKYLSPALMSLAFSPDGKFLAGGSHDYVVRFWDTKTGRSLGTLKCFDSVGAIAFSPDSQMLACEAGDQVKLWNTKTGQVMSTLMGNSNTTITSLTFSQNGRMLASGNYDGTIKLWNIR